MDSQMCLVLSVSHLILRTVLRDVLISKIKEPRCPEFTLKSHLGLVASKEGYSNHLILRLPPRRNQKRPRKLGSVNQASLCDGEPQRKTWAWPL